MNLGAKEVKAVLEARVEMNIIAWRTNKVNLYIVGISVIPSINNINIRLSC